LDLRKIKKPLISEWLVVAAKVKKSNQFLHDYYKIVDFGMALRD
jgi:hypothetical protein